MKNIECYIQITSWKNVTNIIYTSSLAYEKKKKINLYTIVEMFKPVLVETEIWSLVDCTTVNAALKLVLHNGYI